MLSKVKLVYILEAANELPKQQNKIHWVHPFNVEAKGEKRFRKFYENVRNFETKFFGYYRMSIKSFDELLVLLRPHISRLNTSIRLAISAQKKDLQ
jgi:hypothetical protein